LQVAETMHALANVYINLDDHYMALGFLQDAASIYQTLYEPTHTQVRIVLEQIEIVTREIEKRRKVQ